MTETVTYFGFSGVPRAWLAGLRWVYTRHAITLAFRLYAMYGGGQTHSAFTSVADEAAIQNILAFQADVLRKTSKPCLSSRDLEKVIKHIGGCINLNKYLATCEEYSANWIQLMNSLAADG